MESLSVLEILQRIKEKKVFLLDYVTLSAITEVTNKNTLYKIAQRLVKNNILTQLSKGLFVFTESHVSEFEIANFMYQPSYVSLESALSFYGILPQFPYSITSLTTRKTKKVTVDHKEYTYSTVDQNLFWGYEKKNNMLIATPEKALMDVLYFSLKGISKIDIDDLDLSILDTDTFLEIGIKFNNEPLLKLSKELVK